MAHTPWLCPQGGGLPFTPRTGVLADVSRQTHGSAPPAGGTRGLSFQRPSCHSASVHLPLGRVTDLTAVWFPVNPVKSSSSSFRELLRSSLTRRAVASPAPRWVSPQEPSRAQPPAPTPRLRARRGWRCSLLLDLKSTRPRLHSCEGRRRPEVRGARKQAFSQSSFCGERSPAPCWPPPCGTLCKEPRFRTHRNCDVTNTHCSSH